MRSRELRGQIEESAGYLEFVRVQHVVHDEPGAGFILLPDHRRALASALGGMR